MALPLVKICPHLNLRTIIEEQPYFDVGLSEVCYTKGSYECLDCLETIYIVDGISMTMEEKIAHDKDVDSIPF